MEIPIERRVVVICGVHVDGDWLVGDWMTVLDRWIVICSEWDGLIAVFACPHILCQMGSFAMDLLVRLVVGLRKVMVVWFFDCLRRLVIEMTLSI